MSYFLMFWGLCALVGYGYGFGYCQREFPNSADKDYFNDMVISLGMSFFGPLNLISIVRNRMTKHGLKFL